MTKQIEDPFSVFDTEDEEANNDLLQLRDASCGALVFHSGTEQALLQFVKNGLSDTIAGKDLGEPSQTRIQQMLSLVDQFCMSTHWMMHVGDQKGLVLQEFLARSTQQQQSSSKQEFVIVELGTYCGYSMLRLLQTALVQKPSGNVRLVSVDVNPNHQAVAKEMATIAGIQQHVTFVLLDVKDQDTLQLSKRIQSHLREDQPIDFLFIDHDKDCYLSDLQQLEQSKLVKKGTHVCADNVVVFQLEKYRTYLQRLGDVVETRLERTRLEYVNEATAHETKGEALLDGLGKVV
jgi:catechol O-methyltransferase